MRAMVAIVSLLFVVTCYALKIASIDYAPITTQNFSEANNQLLNPEDIRLPVTSHIQAGKIERHSFQKIQLSTPLFVIGDDEQSKQWLRMHAKNMQNLHALGLVANIQTKEHLQQLEKLAGMPLMPVNVDELSEILEVSHYPYVFESRVIWQ